MATALAQWTTVQNLESIPPMLLLQQIPEKKAEINEYDEMQFGALLLLASWVRNQPTLQQSIRALMSELNNHKRSFELINLSTRKLL